MSTILCADGAQASRQPEVHAAMGNLEYRIDMLNAKIDTLHDRLQLVLRAEPPEVAKNCAAPRQYQSKLSSEIASLTDRLVRAHDALDSICSRLEV